jgi:hypothetical protein
MSTTNTPTSVLGATAAGAPQVTAMTEGTQPEAPAPQVTAMTEGTQPDTPSQATPVSGGSRLSRIVQAVAQVADTALASVPDKGRPSFVTGLGEGARSEQAAQATQQNIKFKTFDDSLRVAALHNQDKELALRTQEQQDAHQKQQDFQNDYNDAHGIKETTIPNHGDSVVDHLTAQTTANGAATVPPGTQLSADGSTIKMPVDSEDTDKGMLEKYNEFAPAYGLPSLPRGAQFVPPKYVDYLNHSMQGYGLDGNPINHDDLEGKIAALQSQRDSLAKSNATPDQLTALDNTLGILKSNQTALDAHQAGVFKQQQAQQLDTLNKSEAIKAKYKEQEPSTPSVDSLGVTITPPAGGAKQAAKIQTSFKKDADSLSQTESTFDAFQDALSDINSGKDITGAKSVTTLFNAIGLSATPLKGMGMRINQNTVAEHVNARDVGQSLYSKLLKVNDGDVITPQQIKDYASIAAVARQSAYVNKINEARSYGLDPSFLLPAGNGRHIDPNTASIYLQAANGNKDAARKAANAKGWNF